MVVSRSKPVICAAEQFIFNDAIEGQSIDEVQDRIAELVDETGTVSVGDDYILIQRSDGKPDLQVELNDWVVKLDNGEVAILSPEAFSAIFEEIEDANNIAGDISTEQVYLDDNGLLVEHITAINGEAVKPGTYYQIQTARGISPVDFQAGSVPENGVNGATNEAILTIVQHRTNILNTAFPSTFNTAAIASIGDALQSFNDRTADRQARGVVGTQQE